MEERLPSVRSRRPLRPVLRAPLLLGPANLFVLVGLMLPLALMLRISFNHYDPAELMVSALSLENYARFFADPFYQGILWRTLWVSLLSTLICLVLGFPVAYFMARFASARMKGLLVVLIVIPLLIGNAVRSAAWMLMLGDKGVLAALLHGIGFSGSLGLMYTTTGVIVALVSVLLPFMVITLHSVIVAIDQNLEDAASSLGAGHCSTLWRVVLPLALPGLLSGTLLCFILSMNAYATPVLIGGPEFHMMAPTVYQQVSKVMNWPFGAALAFVLMVATLVLTVTANVLVQRRYRRWTE